MTAIVWMYLIYLGISVALTVWVATTLHKNGRVFLVDAFAREDLADSINHLLVIGFYLINIGFVALFLKVGYTVNKAQDVIEGLSGKLGVVLLVLGGMHFFNLFVFSRIRRRPTQQPTPPPIPPTGYVKVSQEI